MHSRTKITVRYAETDKMGIAHHSNYPIWYEVGRSDYIKMFGTSYSEMEEAGVMTPLINLTCHFGLPALYEDELIIRTKVIFITAARIIFSYTVKRIEDDRTETELGYGTTEHGFVDTKNFRPCNIKKRMPELFKKISAVI
ncbi:MAG: acyl-CoA thioesterase [Clostridiales bacterium]|nr:acyl-CoA thioesterase [Clostridiales bacterium]